MKHGITPLVARIHRVATVFLLLSLAGFYILIHWNEPAAFYTTKYDPELPYLLNSLSVFKGKNYTYIEHPGIPLELLGTGLLALTYPLTLGTTDTFVMYHISHPELFLTLARALLTLSSMVCVFLLARHAIRMEHWTDAFFSIAVAATFFAVYSPISFNSLVYWSHNSINLPCGSLLLLGLLVRLRSNQEMKWWEISLFGIGAGILTAVQIYFATWILGIAIAVGTFILIKKRSWRHAFLSCLVVGISSISSFLIATLPMVKRYRYFGRWIKNILFHQGRFGYGPAGITSPTRLLNNFIALWNEAPIFVLAEGLVIVLIGIALFLHRHKLNKNPGLLGVACGLSVQSIATLLIILKHPGPLYLMAVAAIMPLLLSVAYSLISKSIQHAKLAGVVLGIAILFGFIYGLIHSITENRDVTSEIYAMEAELREHITTYSLASGKHPDTLSILWGYGMGSRCFSLHFGNIWAGNYFDDEIRELCPHDGRFTVWDQKEGLVTGKEWDIIVIPEKFLPEDAKDHGTVIISNLSAIKYEKQWLGYGRVVFILAADGR